MKSENQSLNELYAELEKWKPLDDAKRHDVQLAVQKGWHVVWVSWGPAWYYHDEEIAVLNPKLTEVWTGYWVFDTRVRWEDQTDDSHRIFSVKDGKLTLAYSSGSEWAPTMKISDRIRNMTLEDGKRLAVCEALLIALAGELANIMNHGKRPTNRTRSLIDAVEAYERGDLDQALFEYDVASGEIPDPKFWRDAPLKEDFEGLSVLVNDGPEDASTSEACPPMGSHPD